jgi:uncharacterized repeat protein (TIGR02543 family)
VPLNEPPNPPVSADPWQFDPATDIPDGDAELIRPGYVFDGWNSVADGSGILPPSAPVGVNANASYYAMWRAIPYDIIYTLNGGINAAGNPTGYTVADSFPIHIDNPTREGYIFLGWTALGGMTQDVFTLSFDIQQGAIGDVYLTAHWSPISFNINYLLSGGVNIFSNPTSYTIEDTPLAIANPVRLGNTFTGWTATGGLSLSTETKNLTLPAGTDEDIILTAHWIENVSNTQPPDQNPADTGDETSILWVVLLVVSLVTILELRKRVRL